MSASEPVVRPDLRCENCPVRHHAICRALDGSHLHELSDIMIHRRFKAGAEIVHQDDTSELFAIIVSGVVKLTRMLPDGRQQIVGLLSEADCLGDVFSAVSHDNAECVTDVDLCCFRRKQIETVLKARPELEHRLLQKATEDLEEARQWMLALGRKTATEKVATFLLWLRNEEQNHCSHAPSLEDDPIVYLPISRGEIADFLGLTIETVSRIVSKLNTSGVIRLIDNRCIEICDLDGLRRVAEPEI